MFTNEVDAVMCLRSALIGLLACSACTAFDHELPECTTNDYCTTKLSAASGQTVTGVCVQPEAKCVQLESEDCTTTPAGRVAVTGNYMESPVIVPDNAVLIASLLATTGPQAATNLARERSARMAVEEINTSGGILQSTNPGDARKLVMLSCDENADLVRVSKHLINDLHVAGIVGPNLSQDMIDLTQGDVTRDLPSSAAAGTAMLSPSAVAAKIADIPDNGLSFMMVPSDVQRVPLMEIRINALEAQLKTQRMKPTIKLAIYYRSDALGVGTHDSLTKTLTLNGAPLSAPSNGGAFRDDVYDPASMDNSKLVTQYLTFKPDIIVVIGTAEAVTFFTNPLETAWQAQMPTVPKPYYVAIDSTKVPELLTAVGAATDDQRKRWSGTGITPTSESAQAFNSFQLEFGNRWKDQNTGKLAPATVSGMGPAYDAVYTMALSLVVKHDPVIHGATIAAGMPNLANNMQPCASDATGLEAPCFLISDHSSTLDRSMKMLLAPQPVTEIGTFGRLEWDADGNKSNGLIELWCIDGSGSAPVYASSGQTYDVKSQTMAGSYTQCGP
jgi:ABC-type branched-subunit amino acid transport system substrate-binding protein